MTIDVSALRLLALDVPGVARLADHHGSGLPTSRCALRVFDDRVEIDIVLAIPHSVTGTGDRLRATLGGLLAGRPLHITVEDVERGE
ncbi:hypothetical protein [Actinomycetospora atypica]|uniref:Uncharacterized protein n=1 Tax=Actinomycetospora atypica TaxID=1290095 RepID=A0ABV9YJA5_9PSEU